MTEPKPSELKPIEQALELARAERDKHQPGTDAHLGLCALCARIALLLPDESRPAPAASPVVWEHEGLAPNGHEKHGMLHLSTQEWGTKLGARRFEVECWDFDRNVLVPGQRYRITITKLEERGGE